MNAKIETLGCLPLRAISSNIIFNSFIGYFKFSGWHIIEYLFITLLLIVEFLAIRRYYIELKNGELESAFHFIKEKIDNELQ